MVSSLLILVLIQACRPEELPREEILSWFGGRILEGLRLDQPPRTHQKVQNWAVLQHDRARHEHQRALESSRETRDIYGSYNTGPQQDTTQIILFPSSESSCATSDSSPAGNTGGHLNYLNYHFQPSIGDKETLTSAEFWFYTGEENTANISLSILTSKQQHHLDAAEAQSRRSSDGWTTYNLRPTALDLVAQGQFQLRVLCPRCLCNISEPDNMAFLDLHTRPQSTRSRRHAPPIIPWSPFALDLLQRPSRERPEQTDCQRAQVDVSFQELGWDNWIVHPPSLTFFYCHGNCSANGRTLAALGVTQCCAPLPGSMRSLRVTTTSDGGHSFKYETLPNIIPEECVCM